MADDLASFLQGKLRHRAINGPSGVDMLSQLLMLPLGSGARLPSAGRITGGSPHSSVEAAILDRQLQRPYDGGYAPRTELSTGLVAQNPAAFESPAQLNGQVMFPETFYNGYGAPRVPGQGNAANVNEPPRPGSVEAWRMARDRNHFTSD